jgi:hypothetical protein
MQCLIQYETCHTKEHWHKRVALTEYLPCTCSQVHHWIDPERKKISRGPCTLSTHAEWTAVSGLYDMCKGGLENVAHPVRLSSINADYLSRGVITWNRWALCTFEHGASPQPQAVMEGACFAAENQGKWLMCAPHAILACRVTVWVWCAESHLIIRLLQ